MKTLFQSFLEMADHLPAKAIRRTLDRESRMVEEDLLRERVLSWSDGFSIMVFHRFIEAVVVHHTLMPVALPLEHVSGYRGLVKKLVAAHELPFYAVKEFDEVFCNGALQTLAA